MRRALALLLALLPTQVASAQRAVPFEWGEGPGAEVCADADALLTRLDEVLRREGVDLESRHGLRVEGSVERVEGGFSAVLELLESGEPLGRRELFAAGDRCEALTEQVVFVAFLLLSSPSPAPPTQAVPVSPPLPAAPMPSASPTPEPASPT
ncbi:MAG: hypothetical protein H5U40_02680, partial [Polyangiaceae bacterium]|nr:hypothetical protein [Polyangiaceae bacterium]